ncbi:uncharacterized protein LOC113332572 isoform X1 [Papaver somniferum]|uniref:uncharacterized protein LOC113332572 isoform X1 n=1 Tax=Papaver somniferum TaxID=3469 RepID=UPI000E6F60EB|nr:uncharacterized protein LOC113332572 isoform X1 [Papaver somniferum]
MVAEERAAKRSKFDPHMTKLIEDLVDSIFAQPRPRAQGRMRNEQEIHYPVTIVGYTPDWAYTNVIMPMRLLVCIEIGGNGRGLNYDSQFEANRVVLKKAICIYLPHHYASVVTDFVIMWNGVPVSATKPFQYSNPYNQGSHLDCGLKSSPEQGLYHSNVPFWPNKHTYIVG